MREGEKEGEDEEDEAEKEEKRHTRQPPALSTVPVLQYLSYLSWWIVGWRREFPAGGKRETRRFNRGCNEQQEGFSRDRGKRERKCNTLRSKWAARQPPGKDQALNCNYECR